MMKRNYFAMIAVLGFLMLVPTSFSAAQWQPDRKFLRIATAGRAGVWALIAARLAEGIQQEIPGISVSVTGGGGRINPTGVDKGEKELGLSYADLCYLATQGRDPYKDSHKKIRHLGMVYIGYAHLVVLKDSKIFSVADLADKKISPSPAGFGSEVFCRNLLEFYNLSYDKIKAKGGSVSFLQYVDGTEMMKDGHLDFQVSLVPPGHPQFADLAVTKGIRLLPIEKDIMEAFIKKYPGFFIRNFPKDPYQGVEGGFPILASGTVLICTADLSDELVYRVTKALWKGVPEWRKTVASLRETDVKDALLGNQIEVHPGAARYYKEVGLMK